MMTAVKEYWSSLATLPSTNWMIFTGTIMAFSTVLTVNVMMLFRIDAQEEALWPLFSFIAAWAGVSTYQFATKRRTSPEGMEGQAKIEEAKSRAPAPAPPTNVNVAGNANVQQPAEGQ